MGPKRTSASLLLASTPIALATSSTFSLSQEEDRQDALGKHAEVAPDTESPLAPIGPSVIFTLGKFNLGTAVVCQAVEPDNTDTFSSSVSSLMSASILSIEFRIFKRSLFFYK